MTPTRYQLPVGFFRQELDPLADAVFLPSEQVRNGTFQCVGGRHVHHVGGKQIWDWDGGAAERYKDVSHSIFIEGRHIVMMRSGDAFSAGGTYRQAAPYSLFPDVYIQNCRVENVRGSFDEIHADVFQLDYSLHDLKIDCLTADTDYQGLYLRPTVAISGKIDIRRCNFTLNTANGLQPSARLIYLFKNMSEVSDTRHLLYFSEVYCDVPHGLDPRTFFSPRQGMEIAADAQGTYVWWPDLSQRVMDLKGQPARIRIGKPPNGDFAPATSVGLGYRSPGYQTSPTTHMNFDPQP
ncbi:hypothetical protein [Neorhizobium sp. JUb45]|uniref:hypothetical protein n=1 Tax=unclassified Neorhizobium TaxID=2629175 RepID=UPI0010493C46|nr:hypothetical protein [Neorhizobium sp. JUb45]TCQ98254.1 hypothetical protein EDF70_11196 [Neorhizobium sp. JUb45]